MSLDELEPRPDRAALRRLADRLDDLRRRLVLLGDDLADGHAALAWRGAARDQFGHQLAARLDDLSALVAELARARVAVEQAEHTP